jgi:hypothetical protein
MLTIDARVVPGACVADGARATDITWTSIGVSECAADGCCHPP